jgi:hypothetical protein
LVAYHHFVRGDLACLLHGAVCGLHAFRAITFTPLPRDRTRALSLTCQAMQDEGIGGVQPSWLQVLSTRADADTQLARQADGTFLVRRSESRPDWSVLLRKAT